MLDCHKRIFWGPSWLMSLGSGSTDLYTNVGYLFALVSAILPGAVVLAAGRIPGRLTVTILLGLALLAGLVQLAISSFMGLFTAFRGVFTEVCPDPLPVDFRVSAALFLLGYALRVIGYSNAVHYLIRRPPAPRS